MIIYYGTNSTYIVTFYSDESCAKCQTKAAIRVEVDQIYFHLFGLPIIPLYKIYTRICSNCETQFSRSRTFISDDIKHKTRTPLWTYTGSIIIACFISCATYIKYASKAPKTSPLVEILKQPKKGMKFEVKYRDYNILEIESYDNHSISFRPYRATILDHYQHTSILKTHTHDTIITYSKAELKALIETNTIRGIID